MKIVAFLMSAFLIVSCSLMGSKPDKTIRVVIEVQGGAIEVEQAMKGLVNRSQNMGITSSVNREGNSNRIVIDLDTHMNADGIKSLYSTQGDLNLYHCYRNSDVLPLFIEMDTIIKSKNTFGNSRGIFDVIKGVSYPDEAQLFMVSAEDTLYLNNLFKESFFKSTFKQEGMSAVFKWGIAVEAEGYKSAYLSLYALQAKQGKPALSGDVIKNAMSNYGYAGSPSIDIEMDGVGAAKWERITALAAKNHTQIAIVLDDIVYSAPGVSTPGGIKGGRSQITGNFTIEEATSLAAIFRSSGMPPFRIVDFEVKPLQ